jgi:alpha-ketoglutaric semialdehyde dehydrogenase
MVNFIFKKGQLSGTLWANENDIKNEDCDRIIECLSEKVGRIVLNGVPTGLEVCTGRINLTNSPTSRWTIFSII